MNMSPPVAQEPSDRRGGTVDFSFAFLNPRFSDCTLRLHLQGNQSAEGLRLPYHSAAREQKHQSKAKSINNTHSTEGSERVDDFRKEEGAAGERVSKILVSSLVLVAKSAFFEKLFTGSFREGENKSAVDVTLPAEDEAAFMSLLESLYCSTLPQSLDSNLPEILRFIILADRFQCNDSLALATSAIQRAIPHFTPGEALLILDLPDSILQNPNFQSISEGARDSINTAYSGLLKGLPKVGERGSLSDDRDDRDGRREFLDLSERALGTLLEMNTLEVESEDVVAEAALSWVHHNSTSHTEKAEVICRLVLPRIRLLSLSPPLLKTLCSVASFHIKKRIKSSTAVMPDGHLLLESEEESWHDRMCTADFRREEDDATSSHTSNLRATTSSDNLSQQPGRSPALFALTRSKSSSEPSLKAQMDSRRSLRNVDLVSTMRKEAKSGASAVELGLQSMVDALVAFSEQQMIARGAIPLGSQLSLVTAGMNIPQPRIMCEPPHGTISVEVPLKWCREWVPSNAFLATSSHALIRGRWFTMNVQVCTGNSSLGMYLMWDKSAGNPKGTLKSKSSGFQLDYRFCVQTADSFPAYEHVVKSRVTFTESAMGWGRANVLGKSWSAFLQETDKYFPEGGLRLRADICIVKDGDQQAKDDALER